MRLLPAPADTGIVFRRTDVADGNRDIPARYDTVTDTMLGTTISNEDGVKVGTIEHLMAALTGCGIDNLIVEIDAAEVPIMDGSAGPFVFLIECAGVAQTDVPRQYLRVLEPVALEDGPKYAELAPAESFSTDFEIDFPTPVIGRQHYRFDLNSAAFKTELCRARTFGFLHEVDHLKSLGLALGGSLDNAIVIDNDRIINEGPLRYSDEFVRHKVLDAIGDLSLAGYQIKGRFTAKRAGHDINNRILRKLFDTPEAWTLETRIEGRGAGDDQIPVAAR